MRIFSLTLALQAAVQLTLVTGAIPNRPRSLLEAARTGDIDMVELFLSSRRDDLNAGYRGWTPLHEASRKGHSEVVKLLLSHGANPRIAFNGRLPPITIAARHGHAEIVKLLVENGDASPDSLAAAMLFAAYNDRSEVVDYLLAHDANLANARNNGGFHSTELSAENKSGPFCTESSSVLEAAVINDHLDMVAKLVQNGARVNHEEFDRACYFGRKAIVKFLIDNGAEIEPAGLTDWWIPITSAVSTNKIDIVELLIQRGATRGFEVALLVADREYKPRIINLFAEAGLVKDYEIPSELDHSEVFGNYQIPPEFDDWHIIKHLLLAGAKNTVNSDFVFQDLMLPITMIQSALLDQPIHAYTQIYPALEAQGYSYEEGLITLGFEARKVGVDFLSDHSPQGWSEEKTRMVSSIIGDLVYLSCTELNFFYTVAPFLASADEDMLKHAAAAFTFLAGTRGDIQENERFRATNGEILNEMIQRSNHLGLRPVVKALFAIYHEEQEIMTSLRLWGFPQRQQTPGASRQSSLTIRGLPQSLIDLVMGHENGPFNPGFKAKAMRKLTQAIRRIKSSRDSI